MDEELKQQINELIAATVKETVQNVVKEALSPLMLRQQEQLDQFREEIGDTISSSSSKWLDDLIEEADSYAADDVDDNDDDYDYDEDDDEDDDNDNNEAYQRYSQKQNELESAVSQLKRQLDDEKRMRNEVEERQKREAMVNSALDTIQKTGKVRNAKQLLTVLQNDGKILEKDGQFVAPGKDEYGLNTTLALGNAIESLLNSEDYAHFAIARPGTGTGAIPSGGGASAPTGGKWFGTGDKIPDTKDMLDPKNLAEMMRELDSAIKG